PPAPARVGSWEEALQLIRSRSPSYASSAQAVEQAEGASRVALAGVLPSLSGQASYTHQFLIENVTIGGTSFTTPAPNLLAAQGSLAWQVLSPRALHALGTAHRAVDAARLSFADARRQIATGTV